VGLSKKEKKDRKRKVLEGKLRRRREKKMEEAASGTGSLSASVSGTASVVTKAGSVEKSRDIIQF